jgi:hypothetical protein
MIHRHFRERRPALTTPDNATPTAPSDMEAFPTSATPQVPPRHPNFHYGVAGIITGYAGGAPVVTSGRLNPVHMDSQTRA